MQCALTFLLGLFPGRGYALSFANLRAWGCSTDYGDAVGCDCLTRSAVGNVQTAHGSRTAQESLSGRVPRGRTVRIASGIFAVYSDSFEDIVREAALSLARGRLDICRRSVGRFPAQ